MSRHSNDAGRIAGCRPTAFLTLLVAIGLFGCAVGTGEPGDLHLGDIFATKVPFLLRPLNADAGALRSVTIEAAPQPTTRSLAQSLEGAMVKVRIGERPFYQTVKLDPGSRPATSTPADLRTLASRSGTEAALLLTDASSDVKTAQTQEDRSNCNSKAKGILCKGSAVTTTKVSCTETRALAGVNVRMVRASDGVSVLVDTITGQAAQKYCVGDAGAAPADKDALVGEAWADVMSRLMRTIAPSYESRPLDLMNADAKIPEASRKDFDAAKAFAEAKRMDEACPRFSKLYEDIKESPALTFNVAFCTETHGDLLRANQGYHRASDLLNAPNPQVDQRIAYTEKQLRENPIAFAPDGLVDALPPGAGSTVGGAGGGRRVALVIGNARYQRNALVNPVNDASLVSAKLKKIGYDVTEVQNADGARFDSSLRDFALRAKGADIALFFYAGHAIQSDGENWLLPVDNLKMRTVDDVRESGGVAVMGTLMPRLEVAHPHVTVVVLDACRDNPLPTVKRGAGTAGLAQIKEAPQGTFIAYATRPGYATDDGTGKNSVFTRYFVEQLGAPSQNIEDMFKHVRDAVMKATHDRQQPSEVSALVGDVYLAGNP